MTNDQLKKNWDALQNLSDDVKTRNVGRTALLHDGELVAIYNDSGDAYSIGCERYGLGQFTVQTFGVKPKSLGIFTRFVKGSGAAA